MKVTLGGIPVTNFSLALKETYKNGGGEKKTNTLWIRCVTWLRWGEIADPKEPGSAPAREHQGSNFCVVDEGSHFTKASVVQGAPSGVPVV